MNSFEKPSPQKIENPYIFIPETMKQIDYLYIKQYILHLLLFFLCCFLQLIQIFFLLSNHLPFLVPILAVPIILILFCCKFKILLKKDKSKNRLTIVERNYFCCKKTHNLSLDYTVFSTLGCGAEEGPCCQHDLSTIVAINSDPNMTDLDNSNIRNTPFKFIYRFYYLIGTRNKLYSKLTNFRGDKFKNKIKDEIDLYVPEQNIIDKYHSIFMKISSHFYMFYNYNFFSGTKSDESFERLDWIYSNDFDRIFIGVVKNDTSYVNTFIYQTNSIDKFILELKNEKYCFKILLKDGTNTEICRYKKKQEKNLNTFIYLINGQINKINNVNQNQVTSDNSAPTIE